MSHDASEPRYLCSELVTLLYEDPFLILNPIVANLEEISPTRASLFVEERLAPGSPASFHAKGHDLNGFVKSSEYHPTLGWIVEIQLDYDSRWDAQKFTPDHAVPVYAPFDPAAIEAA